MDLISSRHFHQFIDKHVNVVLVLVHPFSFSYYLVLFRRQNYFVKRINSVADCRCRVKLFLMTLQRAISLCKRLTNVPAAFV